MNELISKNRFQEIISKFSSLKPTLVVGDVGVDKYTFGSVSRISPEAPVPIVEVSKEWQKLGLAANVSDNLKSLNSSSTLVGLIGNDSNANLFENLLEESELRTWGIIRSAGRMTTLKERVITKSQQVCRVDYETKGELEDELQDKVIDRVKKFFDEHEGLIIQDYAKGLVTKKICSSLIPLFKEAGRLVCVDPSRNADPLLYKGVTLLKPNLIESYLLAESLGYRKESLEGVAKILIDKLELEKLVITLGGEGMASLDTKGDGQLNIIPTVANEVFDVSGAGDTVISALASALQAGASLQEAAWIGNCSAGVVVGKMGTARVNLDELKAFYEKLEETL